MFIKRVAVYVLIILSVSLFIGCGRIKITIENPKKEGVKEVTSQDESIGIEASEEDIVDKESKTHEEESSKEVANKEEDTKDKKQEKSSTLNKKGEGSGTFDTMPLYEVLFNIDEDKPYVKGDYAEVDFALDLLTRYLNNDKTVYDLIVSYDDSYQKLVPVNEEDKKQLEKNLKSMQTQLEVDETTKIETEIQEVYFNGYDSALDEGIYLMTTLNIHPEGDEYSYWNTFGVVVFERDGKFIGFIY